MMKNLTPVIPMNRAGASFYILVQKLKAKLDKLNEH